MKYQAWIAVGMLCVGCGGDGFDASDTDVDAAPDAAPDGADAGSEASPDAGEPDVEPEAQCAPMDDTDACYTLIDSWCHRMHECCLADGFNTEACDTHTGNWSDWQDAKQVCRDSWKSIVCNYMEGQVCEDDVWACDTTFQGIPCFDIMHRTFMIPSECLEMMP